MKATEYRYDANGNTTRKIENGTQETVYTWNQEKRLVAVQTPTGENISYAYDASGVRVSKTVNGVTTEYLVDSNRDYAQVLEERVNDALIASYLYGLDLISQERGNADSYYLVDGLGSTRGLTDGAGNVTDSYSYDAFGNLIASAGNVENYYLFAGEQFDKDLEQYYLRQRYYESETGRFTRRDTYSGHISDPITLHKYIYANANPVNGVDPSGFATITESLSIINTLSQLAARAYTTVFSPIQAANITAGFMALAAGVLSFILIEEAKKGKKDQFEYKLYPEEPNQKKIIDDDTNDANQMRVQLQYKHQYDHGIALLATPEIGVTKAQVYNGLWHLWQTRGNGNWFPSSQDRNMRRAVVEVSQEVKRRPDPVDGAREQVASSQWFPNGKQAQRADYRVDVENLRGTNLKL